MASPAASAHSAGPVQLRPPRPRAPGPARERPRYVECNSPGALAGAEFLKSDEMPDFRQFSVAAARRKAAGALKTP
jgi:hypothetical protein